MRILKSFIIFSQFFLFFALCKNLGSQEDKSADDYEKLRKKMVESQIIARDVKDKDVLKAMLKVPRHEFVLEKWKKYSYEDHPLPIGYDQTISQPYIVASMTEKLRLKKGEKVLEIGTGSGYQAAILAEITDRVCTIEIIKELAQGAEKTLRRLGYKNVKVKHGDGYKGWKEEAPFDAIIVTAAPAEIPEELIKQLKVGGRMVLPLGEEYQELVLITKTKEGIIKKTLYPVRFVPMVHPK